MNFNGQIYGGDFAKFCSLLRIYELYRSNLKNVCTYFLSCVAGGFCPAKLFSEAAEAALDSAFKPTTLTK